VRYYVTLGADPHAPPAVVDLVELPNGTFEARLDGRAIELDAVPVGRQLSVRVGGHVVDLTTHGKSPEIEICASGYRSRVRVENERAHPAESTGSDAAGSRDRVVRSPMPGRVVKLFVVKGEVVQSGQPLVVLEAMKMENEVRARAAGTVVEVHVAVGEAIDGNATLVTLG
jgi:biotin carboxyl carrier protein